MTRGKKTIIAVLVVVLVGTSLALANQSELFQGKFFFKKPPVLKIDYSKVFWYRGRVVSGVASPVTSPVTSVVVSEVTSPAATSRVASAVTSPVASAVASAVAVDEKTASGIDTKKLNPLTASILQSIAKTDYSKNKKMYEEKAKEDYKKNPQKFTLSQSQKAQLIELYKSKYPEKFTTSSK